MYESAKEYSVTMFDAILMVFGNTSTFVVFMLLFLSFLALSYAKKYGRILMSAVVAFIVVSYIEKTDTKMKETTTSLVREHNEKIEKLVNYLNSLVNQSRDSKRK